VAYAFTPVPPHVRARVVDDEAGLIGVITIDDAMSVLRPRKHEEDIWRLAVSGEGSLSGPREETTKQRLPWLAVNLLGPRSQRRW